MAAGVEHPAFTAPPLPRFGLRLINRSMGNPFDNFARDLSRVVPAAVVDTINLKGLPLACRNLTIPGTKRFSSFPARVGGNDDRQIEARFPSPVQVVFRNAPVRVNFASASRRVIRSSFCRRSLDIIADTVARGLVGCQPSRRSWKYLTRCGGVADTVFARCSVRRFTRQGIAESTPRQRCCTDARTLRDYVMLRSRSRQRAGWRTRRTMRY